MEAKFKKLDGSYYVVGPATMVREGAYLLVKRKKGDACKVQVVRAGSIVEVNGIACRAGTFRHVK